MSTATRHPSELERQSMVVPLVFIILARFPENTEYTQNAYKLSIKHSANSQGE